MDVLLWRRVYANVCAPVTSSCTSDQIWITKLLPVHIDLHSTGGGGGGGIYI